MRIAILTCLNSNDVCTRAACFDSLWKKTGSFSRYKNEEVFPVALFTCNGCTTKPAINGNMQEKIDRIIHLSVDAVHIGKCTYTQAGSRCDSILKIIQKLEENGVTCIDGTH